ncbi:MAG: putative bifunctional diguanylate cyclase/phosphodiesterase [Ferrimicrobium sp.]
MSPYRESSVVEARKETMHSAALRRITQLASTLDEEGSDDGHSLVTQTKALLWDLVETFVDSRFSLTSLEALATSFQRHSLPPSSLVSLLTEMADAAESTDESDARVVRSRLSTLTQQAVDAFDKQRNRELHAALRQARSDQLTSLPNRRAFLEYLPQVIARSQRSTAATAVVIVDVDNFKAINDEMGHQEGDKALVMIARRLQEAIRATDFVARIGGDEFALLIEGIQTRDGLTAAFDRLESVFLAPWELDHRLLNLDASAGATIYPEDHSDLDSLMHHADLALYSAKSKRTHSGLSTACYDPDITLPNHLPRGSLVKHESNLLERITVVYQPIVNLKDGQIDHVEILVRLSDGDGTISPDQFLDALTRLERERLFERVTDLAIAELVQLDLDQKEPLRVAINLEPDLISQRKVIERLLRAWGAAGLNPNRLTIEITERHDLISLAYPSLALLRSAGVRLSIDDFGTGYASLSRLATFDVDEVKLDHSFAGGLRYLGAGLPIISAAVNAANALGVDLVVEGVEDLESAGILRAIGATLAQGYALYLPLTREELVLARAQQPLQIPESTDSTIVAAAQIFTWQRSLVALNMLEPLQINQGAPCSLVTPLKAETELAQLHSRQHRLIAEAEPNAYVEMEQTGRALRTLALREFNSRHLEQSPLDNPAAID